MSSARQCTAIALFVGKKEWANGPEKSFVSTSILVRLGLGIVAFAAMAAGAHADWNPGDPAKWVQLPDLSTTGMDVYDTHWPPTDTAGAQFKILADDWQCTSVDPVTDIHIWGSWLNNHLLVPPAPPKATPPPSHSSSVSTRMCRPDLLQGTAIRARRCGPR
jgi:hypothetical protein